MLNEERVKQMRKLLVSFTGSSTKEGASPRIPVVGNLGTEGLRRRAMVKQIQLAGARYHLQLDIDAFLAAAGASSPSGLDTQKLSILAEWVAKTVDQFQTAAD